MAELHIERNKSIPGWAWLVGLLLLAAIVWWIASGVGERQPTPVLPRGDVGEPAPVVPGR